jgi:hypothetical protein
MFKKIALIAAAVLACSGAMAATQTFTYTGSDDVVSFGGSLTGGITWDVTGWTVLGATGFSNVLLDGLSAGVSLSNQLANGSYASVTFAAIGGATSHTITYDIVNYGTGHAVDLSANFATIPHQSNPLPVNNNPVSSVPEPESYAMLLAGLGALGFVARRRKQA